MTVGVQACAVAALAALLVGAPAAVGAAVQPEFSQQQLVELSDVIVTGRVAELRTGVDPMVNTIYTYITLDVDRVLKGVVTTPQIVVKQLGGRLASRGLRVSGQASFAVGEGVLLFLETRPRDRTLYTVAGRQGKRAIATDGSDAPLLESIAALIRDGAVGGSTSSINTHPADAAGAVIQPFVLFDPPVRFNHLPFVDAQTGGQPGLAGGGFVEIFTAMTRWNSAGSSFAFRAGSTEGPARCYNDELGNGRVTISFNDPCEEIADTGGTLAVGGLYYTTSRGAFINGIFFYEATEGFVVNNDGSAALPFLQNSNCFSDIQLHELGHVLGLDHSRDPSAVMYPTISGACASGARPLGADDLLGLRTIYPPSSITPPASPPQNLRVIVHDTSAFTVTFDPVTTDEQMANSPATSYRLDFSSSATGPILYMLQTTATTVDVSVPPGVTGTFFVSVGGVNSAGPGPSSPRVAFTLPACGAPSTPVGLTGSVVNGVAGAAWTPVSTATSYIVHAGTAPGLSDLGSVNVGNTNAVSVGGVLPGFRAYVRVTAVNACGVSVPTADVLVQ